jgi:preprotein translocase subunit SecB
VSDREIGTQIAVTSLELHRLDFEILDPTLVVDEDLDIRLGFGLGVVRFAEDAIGVEYMVEVAENPALRLQVVYRVGITRIQPAAEGEDTERFWQVVAAQMAPTVAYPYVRELATALITKAGFPPAFMPVLRVGAVFKPEDVDVPPPPAVEEPADAE